MNARLDPRELEPEMRSDNLPDAATKETDVDQLTLVSLVQRAQNLEGRGDPMAAAALYARWIREAPEGNKHFALFNYGGLLQNLGKMDEAQTAYESCIARQSDFAQPYINLGLLHEKQGRTTTALKTWLQLVELSQSPKPPAPEFLTTALNHIGRLQEDLKNYQQAEQALERSLLLDPSQTDALQHWIHIRQKSCSWPIYKLLPGISYEQMRAATSPLAMLAITEDPAEQLAHSIAFVKRKFPLKEEYLSRGRQYNHPRIRVGYVSADFREHAVGFLLPQFFDAHSKEEYELFGYDYTKEEDTEQRRTIRACFQHFKSIHTMTDREAAELILEDEIDILVDLHGLSAGARPGIFALHPAPRQGTYLGFIGPTGMPWFDFVIADEYVIPAELQQHFTEKPIYLNSSFIPTQRKERDINTTKRSDIGLPETAFVMAALVNTYKITPEIFSVWMRLLNKIENSVLWLIDDNALTTQNLRAAAKQQNIPPYKLIFTPRVPHQRFLEIINLADIFLDTYPYNCGSTAHDLINTGIPMISLYGKTMVSRMGFSLINSIGRKQYIASTIEEYESKIISFFSKKPKSRAKESISHKKIDMTALLRPKTRSKYIETKKHQNANSGESKTEREENIKIYHIAYDQISANSKPKDFILLDNLENKRPDWRELWPIRNFLKENVLNDDIFYGFLSPRFHEKTGLTHADIKQYAEKYSKNSDILILSPFWDLNSLFKNSFYSGEVFHPGLLKCARNFASCIGNQNNPETDVTSTKNTAYCNYFIAKNDFWLAWLELAERLIWHAERNSDSLTEMLQAPTTYGDKQLPMKIFMQERIVNMLLSTGQWKSRAYDAFQLPCSTTPLNKFYKEAITLNALKIAYNDTGDKIYLDEYYILQSKVWDDCNITALYGVVNPHNPS